MSETAIDNLRKSEEEAQEREERRICCPRCQFYIMDAYGRSDAVVGVKCPKCKFEIVLNLAYFRTVRKRNKSGYFSKKRFSR